MTRSFLLALIPATMLVACGGGSANLAGTDTATSVSNVPAMATDALPLQLSGTPAASVRVGDNYSFKPAVTAAKNKSLVFSLQNRPAWIRFDAATGIMSGTPGSADLGNYAGLVLSVSDGAAKLSLPAFSIAVQARSQGGLDRPRQGALIRAHPQGYRAVYGEFRAQPRPDCDLLGRARCAPGLCKPAGRARFGQRWQP